MAGWYQRIHSVLLLWLAVCLHDNRTKAFAPFTTSHPLRRRLEEEKTEEEDTTNSGVPRAVIIFLIVFVGLSICGVCVALGVLMENYCTQERLKKQKEFDDAVAKAKAHVQTGTSLKDKTDVPQSIETTTPQSITPDTNDRFHEAPADGLYGFTYFENGQRYGLVLELYFISCGPHSGWAITGHVLRNRRLLGSEKGTFRGNLQVRGQVACNGDAYWILEEPGSSLRQKRRILVRASFDGSSSPRKLFGGTWHAIGPDTVLYGRFLNMGLLEGRPGDHETVNMDDVEDLDADFGF